MEDEKRYVTKDILVAYDAVQKIEELYRVYVVTKSRSLLAKSGLIMRNLSDVQHELVLEILKHDANSRFGKDGANHESTDNAGANK